MGALAVDIGVGAAVGVGIVVGMTVTVGTTVLTVVGVEKRLVAWDCCQGKPAIPKKIINPTSNKPTILMIHASKMLFVFLRTFGGGGVNE